MINAKIANTEQ